jgi:uncharacterized protein YvpB
MIKLIAALCFSALYIVLINLFSFYATENGYNLASVQTILTLQKSDSENIINGETEPPLETTPAETVTTTGDDIIANVPKEDVLPFDPAEQIALQTTAKNVIPKGAVYIKTPHLNQIDEGFKNGCESASATIVLNYLGLDVTISDMAFKYIPRKEFYTVIVETETTTEEETTTPVTEEEETTSEPEPAETKGDVNAKADPKPLEKPLDEESETETTALGVGEETEKPPETTTEQETILYGPDPSQYYAGNPRTGYRGFYNFSPAEVTGLNAALNAYKLDSAYKSVNISNASQEYIEYMLRNDIPVIIWVNLKFSPWPAYSGEKGTWLLYNTEKEYKAYATVHCMVITGYTDTDFIVCDPLSEEEFDFVEKEKLMKSYTSLKSQACVVVPTDTTLNLPQ